jgi:hypothetical protein
VSYNSSTRYGAELNEVLRATSTEGAALLQMACSPRIKAVLTARCRYCTIFSLVAKQWMLTNCRLAGKLSVGDVYQKDGHFDVLSQVVYLKIASNQLQAIKMSGIMKTSSPSGL